MVRDRPPSDRVVLCGCSARDLVLHPDLPAPLLQRAVGSEYPR